MTILIEIGYFVVLSMSTTAIVIKLKQSTMKNFIRKTFQSSLRLLKCFYSISNLYY